MSQNDTAPLTWMVVGIISMGLLAAGAVAGVDHGLHREFFGPGASIAIGWGAGSLGALLGKAAGR